MGKLTFIILISIALFVLIFLIKIKAYSWKVTAEETQKAMERSQPEKNNDNNIFKKNKDNILVPNNFWGYLFIIGGAYFLLFNFKWYLIGGLILIFLEIQIAFAWFVYGSVLGLLLLSIFGSKLERFQ